MGKVSLTQAILVILLNLVTDAVPYISVLEEKFIEKFKVNQISVDEMN